MNGFQSGSFSAAELTNVELVTWEQFQEQFEETWYDEWLWALNKKQNGGVFNEEPCLDGTYAYLADKPCFCCRSEVDKSERQNS